MTCIFFGHRDTPISVKNEIEKAIINLIEQGVDQFYVGNNGIYDLLVQSILKNYAIVRKDFEYSIVLSHVGEIAISGEQEKTILPEGLETVPPKYAISKRNEWMLKKGDLILAYVQHRYSNSYKWFEKARKKGLCVINLARENLE